MSTSAARKIFILRSLRARLIAILALLFAAATSSGFIMFALFEQSTTARIGQAAALAGRGCDAIARTYRTDAGATSVSDAGDAATQQELSRVTFAALMGKPGIEGGFWQAQVGAFAYAFPTYDGGAPKTDVPQAEVSRIVAASSQAQKEDRPTLTRFDSGSQTLLIAACPLQGPIHGLSAWTMTRVHSLTGTTYWQLMSGLAILVLSVGTVSFMAIALIMTWSRNVAGIVEALAAPEGGELPTLSRTGERELDTIVEALNDARENLIASHRRTDELARQVSAAERFAALGRVTAGVAHEFRNPLAAMRLRAEAALQADGERRVRALDAVIAQIDRLDDIIRRLLKVMERAPLRRETVALEPFLASCVDFYRNLARSKGVSIRVRCEAATGAFDREQMSRALSALIVNALQEDAPQAVKVWSAESGDNLILGVTDDGKGPPDDIRNHLFDPFVSGSPDRPGLGLAMVREIADAHGGRVDFAREDGQSIFRIVVPCPAS